MPIARKPDVTLFPAEAFRLDPLSPPVGEVASWRAGEVLLTGPAGLLGSSLLEGLLASTNAVVHCLVRPTAGATAERRMRDVLEGFGRALPTDLAEAISVMEKSELVNKTLGDDVLIKCFDIEASKLSICILLLKIIKGSCFVTVQR